MTFKKLQNIVLNEIDGKIFIMCERLQTITKNLVDLSDLIVLVKSTYNYCNNITAIRLITETSNHSPINLFSLINFK